MRYRLTALITVLAAFAGQPAAAAELATYLARYNLVLEELGIPGEVSTWEGAQAVRIARDCQKWTLRTEYAVTLALVGGKVVRIHSVKKYYESIDGTRLEFEVLTKTNGAVTDHKKGVAVLQGRGEPGRATYSIPKGKTLDLPAGTEFPVSGTASLVSNLAKGKTEWRQILFHWGELMTISNTVDGKGISLAKQPKGDTELTKFSGWRVNSTLRLQESGQEMRGDFLVHPNGLASQQHNQTQILSFASELVEIKALPAPEC